MPKRAQGVIENDHVYGVKRLRQDSGSIQLYLAIASTFGRPISTRIIDQDLAHQPRRNRQKMCPVLGIGVLPKQAQIGFVHQGATLQRMTRSLPAKMIPGYLAQFLVDQRDKSFQSLLVSPLPTPEQLSDWMRTDWIHGE